MCKNSESPRPGRQSVAESRLIVSLDLTAVFILCDCTIQRPSHRRYYRLVLKLVFMHGPKGSVDNQDSGLSVRHSFVIYRRNVKYRCARMPAHSIAGH